MGPSLASLFLGEAISPQDLVVRLVAAVLLGGVLGFEREVQAKPAGLRTHMMVSLGAACFSLAALGFAQQAVGSLDSPAATQVDPTRVVDGIVGGIGFLGAGAIIRNSGSVEGLTTAGSIWLVGAIGIACGAGNFLLAGVAVVLAVLILLVVGWAEHRLVARAPKPRAPGDG